jgi:hypothetical protein
MVILAIFGFLCFGLFVGVIVGWYLNQDTAFDAKSINSIIVVVGSRAVSFIPLGAPK